MKFLIGCLVIIQLINGEFLKCKVVEVEKEFIKVEQVVGNDWIVSCDEQTYLWSYSRRGEVYIPKTSIVKIKEVEEEDNQ